jgi:hypothetical protein
MGQTIAGGRIFFNGREYRSADEMPADARRAYEQAIAAVSRGDGSGGTGPARGDMRAVVSSKIVFNGHEYGSPDEMPAEARRVYERIMADENGNGTPDLLEMKGRVALRALWTLARSGAASTSSTATAAVRSETTGWRFLLLAAAVLIAYLAYSVLAGR